MNLLSDQRRKYLWEIVDEDFDQHDPVRAAFIKVVTYIMSKPENSLNKLSFGMLANIAGLQPGDGLILHKAIAYLIGERAKVLEMKYEFQDEDFFHVLTKEEEFDFIQNDVFVHPRLGEEIEDCRSHIYVFFKANYGELH